jgi:hypothetical protein
MRPVRHKPAIPLAVDELRFEPIRHELRRNVSIEVHEQAAIIRATGESRTTD